MPCTRLGGALGAAAPAALLLTALAAGLAAGPPPALAGAPPETTWTATWNGPGNRDDVGTLLALDPTGPVYVAGTTYEVGAGEDFALLRYDLDGNLDWSRRYGGPGPDAASALLVPQPGRVAVSGFSWDGTENDVATLVYDETGAIVWEERFPLAGSIPADFPPRMVRDAGGNLLVTAQTGGDFLLLKYAPDGTLLWDRTYDGPGGGADRPCDVAVDAAGDVYVTGIVLAAGGAGEAYATVKYDAAGTFQWEQFEAGAFGSVFPFAGVEVAPDGDVVVAGNPESTCGVFQLRVWKLDAATGDSLWLAVFPPDPCDSVEPVDLAVAGDGSVLVAGFGIVDTVAIRFQTVKYDTDGQLLWHREFDGPGTSSDVASSLALDANGAVYVAGLTTFPPQNRDYVAVKYSAGGVEEWSVHWPGPFGTNDGAEDVAVSAAGDLFLTGHVFDPAESENVVTIRWGAAGAVGVEPVRAEAAAPGGASVRAVRNPFATATTIRFALDRPGPARLTVHDVRGRLVRRLHDGVRAAGRHDVAWRGDDEQGRALPSGVYLLRLETADGVAVGRVGVVR